MKKLAPAILIILIVGSLLFLFFPVKAIQLIINGEYIELDDPVILEGEELFAPAKPIFEELGAYTRWDSRNKVLSAMLGDFQIHLPARSHETTVDGATETWDTPVKMIDEVIYAPVIPTAEALGAFFDWNEETREIIITTPQEFDPAIKNDQEGPLLHVSYPPAQQFYYYADSLFVFGTTESYSQVEVTVNGEPVEMLNRKTGNFLTMIEIPRGEEFPVIVEARDWDKTTTVERTVIYP